MRQLRQMTGAPNLQPASVAGGLSNATAPGLGFKGTLGGSQTGVRACNVSGTIDIVR